MLGITLGLFKSSVCSELVIHLFSLLTLFKWQPNLIFSIIKTTLFTKIFKHLCAHISQYCSKRLWKVEFVAHKECSTTNNQTISRFLYVRERIPCESPLYSGQLIKFFKLNPIVIKSIHVITSDRISLFITNYDVFIPHLL